MKLQQGILLAVLLAVMPVISACDLSGLGNEKQRQQQAYYEEQLKAYQKQQEIQRQQQEAYNEDVTKAWEQWAKEYKLWYEQQQQQLQQLEQLEGMQTDNRS